MHLSYLGSSPCIFSHFPKLLKAPEGSSMAAEQALFSCTFSRLRYSYLDVQNSWWLWHHCLLIWQEILLFTAILLPIIIYVYLYDITWAWGISSWLLQQSAAIAPYLGRGVSPHLCPSWPSTWDSSSRPSCARTAMAPWMWVGPPGHRPWPRAWVHGVAPPAHGPWPQSQGNSSRPPPLTSDAGYLLSTAPPGLGPGVAPLGPSCAIAVWYSRPLPLTSDVG